MNYGIECLLCKLCELDDWNFKNLVNENSGASQQNISVDSNNMVTTTNVYSLVAIDGKTCDGGLSFYFNSDFFILSAEHCVFRLEEADCQDFPL